MASDGDFLSLLFPPPFRLDLLIVTYKEKYTRVCPSVSFSLMDGPESTFWILGYCLRRLVVGAEPKSSGKLHSVPRYLAGLKIEYQGYRVKKDTI